jgi:hypothetical protein
MADDAPELGSHTFVPGITNPPNPIRRVNLRWQHRRQGNFAVDGLLGNILDGGANF